MKPTSFKLVWDRNALDQFKEILAHLETQSNQAPKIVKAAILDRIKAIKSNPLIFEADKLKYPPDNNFRAFVIFSFRITYQIRLDKHEIR
ncbi:MAG: type II toxin-antitoxin system RelE/ParE family toxin, partial [Bacteroidetes bacterium]|nr:type II toxin-antitoxin system RelE/ParE family toxin [Bacteroidota bacterium]